MEHQTKQKYRCRRFSIQRHTAEQGKRMTGHTGNMIRTELKRLAGPAELLRTFCLSVIVLLLCGATYIRQHAVSDLNIYDVFEGIFNGGYFTELLLIPIGYVVTTNVCADMVEKAYRFYVIRGSIRSFILCRYIIDIVFTFFMTEVVLHACFLPGISFLQPVAQDYVDFTADVYKDLLKLHPVLYYELRMLWISLITCVFIAVGMMVSAAIRNLYVAVLAPFLSYVLITRLQLIFRIPTHLSYEMILSGFVRTHASVGKSAGWILLYMFINLLVLGLIFYGIMIRRIRDEKF